MEAIDYGYEIEPKIYDLSIEGIIKAKKQMLKDQKKKDKKKNKEERQSNDIVSFDDKESIKRKQMEELKKKADAKKAKAMRNAEKLREEKAKARHQAEIDVIQLIARRDLLRGKLSRLDGRRKKDAIKIASINIELVNIEEALTSIKKEYGITMNDIDKGSKVSRFFNRAKEKVKSAFKKVKKFFRRNSELIVGMATIILPVVGSIVVSMVSKG